MFPPGCRVGVAVSGGADSVCLLHVLNELRPRWDLRLSVLHLDHGLRGEESRGDARFVAELAASLGLEVHIREWDVRGMARESGDNLEQAARKARQEFFLEFLAAGRLDRVALGHTRSDQAETVLFRFLRGAGTAGLAGIRPVTAEGLVRPLLGVERREVEAYLRERGLLWREDSTNADVTFDRNRIRHQLLPALEREWNPALAATLANMADWALEEEAWWEGHVARLAAEHLVSRPPAVLVRADALAALPPAAARRLLRHAIERVKGDLRGIDFEHIRTILEMASAGEGHGRTQAPGVDVMRSFEWLRIAPREAGRERDFRLALSTPGRVKLPDGSLLCAELIEMAGPTAMSDSVYNGTRGCLDWERLKCALAVRNWRPGDQYQPIGHPCEERLKLLFQKERIPLWERRTWPVLVTGGEAIVWSRRFGGATAYAAGPESRVTLSIYEAAE
jgi:tRNA(Ile)-lysidine synthase